MKLTLPLPPNRANAREHWRVTHRKKVAYYNRAKLALYTQCGVMKGDAFERPTLTATLYVWNRYDPDGATALLKWPIDCLVNYGILVDDSEKHLDFREIPIQVIDRKNQRVEIELTPCDLPIVSKVEDVWEYIGGNSNG